MNTARDEILGRIRAAIADADAAEPAPFTARPATLNTNELVARFTRRAADYHATITPTTDPAATAATLLAGQRVLIPPDLPTPLRPAGIELVPDTDLTPAELDTLDAVLTTCAAACADTGTIALDSGPGQGRRATTLIPDHHLCILHADQIVETVPQLVEALTPAARTGRPITLISGPSATSDIELDRIEGVHGPRTLTILIAV